MHKLNRLNGSKRRRFGLALTAIALVAAILVAGGLATSPRTAEAQTFTAGTAEIAPGETTTVHYRNTSLSANGGDWVNFRILPSSTARGSFLSGGGQTLACRDGKTSPTVVVSACDSDGAQQGVLVLVTIAKDSPNGPLVISAGKVGDAGTTLTVVINVTSSLLPAKVTLASNPSGIAANGSPNSATLTLKAVNAAGAVVRGQSISLTTTLGTLNCDSGGGGTARVQSCIVATTAASAGFVVKLYSTSKAGIATITATSRSQPSLTATVNVVIYGPAAKITLAPDQETIAQRGVTFVVATVTDAGGNAVVNHQPTVPATGVKGPSATAVKVFVQNDVPRTAPPPTIPACTQGTNAKGQCVFRVSGQNAAVVATTVTPGATASPGATSTATATATATATPTATATRGRGWQMNDGGVFAAQTTAKAATRGAHMITVNAQNSTTVKATTTIMVGGPPKAIATDAPARVKALSETRITATITDDTNVRVGAVPVSVDQIEGDGKITLGATTNASMSSDGRYSFSFLAPRSGRVAFLVSAGAAAARISETIVIQVGDAPPAKTWSGTPTSGWNNLTWDGADGAAVADNIGPNVTAVYRWNVAAQRWDAYFPSASGVPGGNDFTTLMQGATYWVFSR